MAEVVIYGASDDLIEVEGAIREEFYANNGERHILGFNDGTLLQVHNDDDGIWRILPLVIAEETSYSKDEATSDDGRREDGKPAYSDVVTLTSTYKFVWALYGGAWVKAGQL